MLGSAQPALTTPLLWREGALALSPATSKRPAVLVVVDMFVGKMCLLDTFKKNATFLRLYKLSGLLVFIWKRRLKKKKSSLFSPTFYQQKRQTVETWKILRVK